MRDRGALADSGRAETLPLQQRLEDLPLVLPDEARSLGGKIVQGLLLGMSLEGGNDRLGAQEVEERHWRNCSTVSRRARGIS
jgi:hypothetical protein